MVEFAPTPVIIVKFRTEKEVRVSFRKILHVSVSLSIIIIIFFLAFCFSVLAKKGFECTLGVRGCVYKYV